MLIHRLCVGWVGFCVISVAALAGDWPTYRHDNRRGAASSERIDAPRLKPAWHYRSPLPPNPAWAGAAKWDAYHSKKDLTPMRDYDLAHYPIIVGDKMYYGSSSDDAVHCVDAKTGERLWRYTTGGPIRIAPSLANGKLYFGSDDGYAYCIDATTGDEVWRFSPAPNRRLLLNNSRLISTWPIRTGVVVEGNTAYFAASLLPWKESYLCAVDTVTGKPEGTGRYVNLINAEEGRTFEAAMAANESLLFAPQGRVWLLAYNLANGKRNQDIRVVGAGSFVMITPDGFQAGGGGARNADVSVANLKQKDRILTHGEALSMVVSGERAFLQTAGAIAAIDWKTNKALWKVQPGQVFAHIVAGDVVFAGGKDLAYAYDAATGQLLWQAEVDGDAHGLAVADGALFVSTHTGSMHCFRPSGQPFVAPASSNTEPSPPASGQGKGVENAESAPPVASLAAGPFVRFITADSAEVRWSTPQAVPSKLEFVEATALASPTARQLVEDAALKTDHVAMLRGLKRGRDYNYRIWVASPAGPTATAWHACENFFNFELPLPTNAEASDAQAIDQTQADTAKEILSQSGVRDGICLVYGVATGDLAYHLAANSKLRVVCVDEDEQRIAQLRDKLQKTGMYGGNVCALAVPSLSDLPLPDGFANLIVSESGIATGKFPGSMDEVNRVLRPAGGVALIEKPEKGTQADWKKVVRGKLPNSGDWTHQYGTAANQAYCGETLAGSTTVDDMQVQWMGHPGPRYQPDRQVRKPSPLAANGRLYMQGLERLIAADAYNGKILWSMEMPGQRRFNMPRDASNMCADDDYVYLAAGHQCLQLDGATGSLVRTLDAVQPDNASWEITWGYLANQGDLLYGTSGQKNSAFGNFWGNGNWFDSQGGWDTAKVCSDNLFAYDKHQGKLRWTHSGGVLLHTTIAMGPKHIYFLECRNEKIKQLKHRTIGQHELFEDLFLVALDAATGELVWEHPVTIGSATVMASLSYGNGKLVLMTSGDRKFFTYVFDAATGSPVWDATQPWPTDNHGGHLSRPAIVNDTLMVRPKSYNLHSGEELRDIAWGGCGSYACSSEAVFYRSGNIAMFVPETGQVTSWSRLRPDCWISTIPACGMVLSPEGGGGCWCSIWMETSAGFMPATLAPPRFAKPERTFVGYMNIELATPTPRAEIRYTLDGSEPTAKSPLYTKPFEISDDQVVVKARSFLQRAPGEYVSSDVTAAMFERQYPAPEFTYKPTYFARPQAIGITKQDRDGEIRYTVDGSEPGLNSTKYDQPFTIDATTLVKTAVYYPSGRRTVTAEKEYRKTQPVSLGDQDLVPGLKYTYAEYWGDKIPDYSTLTTTGKGLVDNFSIGPRLRDDGFAMRFAGYINLPADGEYTFYLRSDDGSRLYIGDKLVVDNDGMHDANATKQGKIELKAGPHPIRVDYFELVGGEVLETMYEGPQVKRQIIPPDVLYHIEE